MSAALPRGYQAKAKVQMHHRKQRGRNNGNENEDGDGDNLQTFKQPSKNQASRLPPDQFLQTLPDLLDLLPYTPISAFLLFFTIALSPTKLYAVMEEMN